MNMAMTQRDEMRALRLGLRATIVLTSVIGIGLQLFHAASKGPHHLAARPVDRPDVGRRANTRSYDLAGGRYLLRFFSAWRVFGLETPDS